MTARNSLGVVLGAVGGVLARWAVTSGLGEQALLALVLVNALGCVVMGVLLARPLPDERLQLGTTAGFCGALTTFAGVAVAVAERLDVGEPVAAAGWLLLIGGGSAAGFLGGTALAGMSNDSAEEAS